MNPLVAMIVFIFLLLVLASITACLENPFFEDVEEELDEKYK